MNNHLNFQFGMYEPATDSIIVNAGENSVLIIPCKDVVPPIPLMTRMMLYIFTGWKRNHLFCMPNWH